MNDRWGFPLWPGSTERQMRVVGALMNIVTAAILLFAAYGVTAIILRYAFGLLLPNPFDLLPSRWS
jgi:hypothetical protein